MFCGKIHRARGEHEVDGNISVRLLLQRVGHPIVSGSTHLDFKVRDASKAIAEIEAIGGKLRKSAAFYPNAENPDLEWAVMQDPWERASAAPLLV